MGIEPKNHNRFRPDGAFAAAWLRAIDDLTEAARDTAEFHSGAAIGRSRQASIRRLKAAVDRLEALELAIGASVDELGHAEPFQPGAVGRTTAGTTPR